MRKLLAFVRRDLQNEMSYRTLFLGDVLGALFAALTFFFLSRMLAAAPVPSLAPYGGSYFPFVLIGIAFSALQAFALTSFSATISSAQQTGTLEALLATQTDIPVILAGSACVPLLRGILDLLLYSAAGILFFGVRLPGANVAGALVALALSLAVFTSIGLLSASFCMVFKKGDPFAFILGVMSALLSGVMYPVAILPPWLRHLAVFSPLTHSLEAVRRALLAGAPTRDILPSLAALAAFFLALGPCAVACFARAVRRAKREGTLTQY